MDKPVILSVKDWIIRRMSTDRMIAESVIEAVVNHQFNGARNAMERCNSIEFSGFGKLFFNKGKGIKRLNKFMVQRDNYILNMNNPELSEAKRKSAEFKLSKVVDAIETLKAKLNED